MTSLIPGQWQQDAIDLLSKHLGDTGGRAALLQLPTGFGKSLVATRLFHRLQRQAPRLQLAIVLPKQLISAGWKRALCETLNISPEKFDRPFPQVKNDQSLGVLFCTKGELKKAMLARRGRTNSLARTLTSTPYLIVVDELHRLNAQGGLVEILCNIFRSTATLGKAEAEKEQGLASVFRSPKNGKRSWPKWLLLSATPINPVSLDRTDPLDTDENSDTADYIDFDTSEVNILVTAAEKTYSALAQLDGKVLSSWFKDHIENIRDALDKVRESDRYTRSAQKHLMPIRPPDKLAIFPAHMPKLRSGAKRRTEIKSQRVDSNAVDRAIEQVVLAANTLGQLGKYHQKRWAMTERMVLSGGLVKVGPRKIQAERYSPGLVSSVAQVVKAFREEKQSVPEKLSSLIDFVNGIGCEHILIFCTHRAVANSVVKQLRTVVGKPGVKQGKGTEEASSKIRDWFNAPSGERRVLVTTDAWSESIDLHERANILVHYELPWSPLRVLQRVGRLWRIRETEVGSQKKPTMPRLPAVIHFAHPGSVDEEIRWRLQRRWAYLRVLGLDSLSFEQAMGIRFPSVPRHFAP